MSGKDSGHYFQGKRVLVVGLGVHGGGVATTKWLVAQGAHVRVIDSRPKKDFIESLSALQSQHISYHFGPHRAADWRWAQHIVVNPAVSPTLPGLVAAETRGVPVDNEASIFLRYFPGTTVAVTGTRGKTTTTLLLGSIIRRHHRQTFISGNIRDVAMLAYMPRSHKKTIAVLELSSFQLERLPVTGRAIHVAVLTNLKVDHLNRHGTMAVYRATKFHIFSGQTVTDWKVLPWDDASGRQAGRLGVGQTTWFAPYLPSHIAGITVAGSWVVEQHGRRRTRLLRLSSWRLMGEHNLRNLLAAVAAARAMGISTTTIRDAVTAFRGVPHRQEVIGQRRGHLFVNDTAATSPDGALAAMAVYPRGFFIVGGTDKKLSLQPLAATMIRQNIPAVFLPGNATDRLVKLLRSGGYRQPYPKVYSMASAVKVAVRLASPGQPILLSPGAASFGLFRHEFHRGEVFRQIVQTL